MKRLLVVDFSVPPTRGPNPSRAWHFARHLGAHGWEAVVLTPRHPKRRLAVDKTREHRSYPIPVRRVHDPTGSPFWLQETGYRDLLFSLRRPVQVEMASPLPGLYGKQSLEPQELALLEPPSPSNAYEKLLCMLRCNPDARAGWIAPGLQAARAVCLALSPDAVYSISPPVTAHRIAMRVAENLKIPWIADLREPWSGGGFGLLDGLRRSRILRLARVYQLPPSFDPMDLQGIPDETQRRGPPIVLVHAGSTASRGRDPQILLDAIRHLLEARATDPTKLRVRLLGPRDSRLTSAVAARFLSGIVTIENDVPWEISLETQAEATALLLALGPGDRGRIPDRLVEAFTVRRKIIGFGPSDASLRELLESTGAGRVYPDSASLAAALIDHLRTGSIAPPSFEETAATRFRAETIVQGVLELIATKPRP